MTLSQEDTDAMLDAAWPPPDAPDPIATPRKCRRHQWGRTFTTTLVPVVDGTATLPDGTTVQSKAAEVEVVGPGPLGVFACSRCGAIRDETLARRGRQSRKYGNRAELAVARTYGGTKVGHAGGPVDVRGTDWNTQVKTHRRKPPAEWTKAFSGMAANRERMPRLLLRFVLGPGQPPQDYFVVKGEDWLAWHGKDGDE